MSAATPPDVRVPPPPSPEEWRRLEPLVDAVLDAPVGQRAALLASLSDGDPARHAELVRLVAECERAYAPLEQPASARFAAFVADEAPPLTGTIAGRYRVLREVGRGGMAIVYLARDEKHGRDVAVKVVRPALAAALGQARFLEEIEIAARLRHPHIVPLYDSGELVPDAAPGTPGGVAAPIRYYVMPYEPGHSLRERLTREGPLPVDDALRIVRDVCEALAHAHEHGVVHRDIKPENVLLSGPHALVTDFGIARVLREVGGAAAPGGGGPAVGTPAYMAPEQAAGDPTVDHRADLYAVGVLAYELLTGTTPSPQGDAMAPRADVSRALAAVIARCLAPRPADRWPDAGALLAALAAVGEPDAPASDGARTAAPARQGPGRRNAVVAAGLLVATAIAVALVVVAMPGRDPRDAAQRLAIGSARPLTSEPGLEVQPALSPDGRSVAYAVGHSLRMHVAVRPAGGGKAVRLTRDTAANEWAPRWSPDGSRLLYLARGGVASVAAGGGTSRDEVRARPGAIVVTAAWSPDGLEIAYVRADSLYVRMLRTGADRLLATGRDLHSCRWSPDDRWLACVSGNAYHVTVGATGGLGPMFGNRGPSRIVLVPARGGTPRAVTDSGAMHQSPAWSRDGRTLYYVSNRQGPRDVYALDVATSAADVVGPRPPPVRVTTGLGAKSIDLSADGRRIVYAAYTTSANVWAMPVSTGAPASLASVVRVTSANQTVEGVRVSPDGRWVVYDSDLAGASDVYRLPAGGGDPERLTHGPRDEFRGALSPDGRELAFHAYEAGVRNIFLSRVGERSVQQLTRPPGHHSFANWSPDGRALVLFDIGASTVSVMRRDSRGRWSAPRFTGGRGLRPEWSPDGRTIAFVAPAGGRIAAVPADSGAQRDLYVPGDGDPLAELAIYSADGRHLYFKSHDAQGRASFWSIPAVGGRPRLLGRLEDPTRASNRFEFASDGRRFYFTIEDRQSDVWLAEVGTR